MAKYRLKGRFFDGIQLRVEGEIIEFDGKPNAVMEPVQEEPKPEAEPTLEDLTVHQLREVAKAEGVPGGITTLSKADLIEAILSLRNDSESPIRSES
jgi:hypothetical protein